MTEPDLEPPLTFYNPAAVEIDTEMVIALIAEMRIRKAIERGEFDNLPGSGKPLDLPKRHDPDWWLKSLVKRAGLVMLPPSIQLRKENAALDEKLEQLSNEKAVRREIEQFNKQVIRARYQLPVGPPLITMPRDIEATVTAWADRRAARAEEARRKAEDEARAREESKANDRNRRRLIRRQALRQRWLRLRWAEPLTQPQMTSGGLGRCPRRRRRVSTTPEGSSREAGSVNSRGDGGKWDEGRDVLLG